MSKYDGSVYRIGRISANLTQEQAENLLHISRRVISDWECGNVLPDDDKVDLMAQKYKVDNLPFYHLKRNSPLGKYLPDYIEPKTNGDMAFQGILAKDEIIEASDDLKNIMADGKVTEEEKQLFDKCMAQFKAAGSKALSIEAYGKNVKVD